MKDHAKREINAGEANMKGEGHQYTDEIRQLKGTMNNFKEGLDSLRADVKAIKRALIGSEFGEEGLVNRVKEVEHDVRDLEAFEQKIKTLAAVIGAASGAIVTGIIQYLFG